MLVCCFHTGGPYAAEAERLERSLQKLRLDYRIDVLPSRGSWEKNILITPEYIRGVLDRTDEDVLYVDADAEFHRVPVFDKRYDLAVHYLEHRGGRRELLDGTLWLANNAITRSLVDQWCAEVREGEWEQVTLQRILEERDDIRVNELSPAYCYIFDTSRRLYPDVQPIIEHHQASRRLKREVLDAPKPAP